MRLNLLELKIFFYLVFLSLILIEPARAHHSLVQGFKEDQRIFIRGVVDKFYLRNPHSFMFVKVNLADQKVLNYRVEFAPATMIKKNTGWTREQLKKGESVEISGYPARKGLRVYATVLSQNGEKEVVLNLQTSEKIIDQHRSYHEKFLLANEIIMKHDANEVNAVLKEIDQVNDKD